MITYHCHITVCYYNMTMHGCHMTTPLLLDCTLLSHYYILPSYNDILPEHVRILLSHDTPQYRQITTKLLPTHDCSSESRTIQPTQLSQDNPDKTIYHEQFRQKNSAKQSNQKNPGRKNKPKQSKQNNRAKLIYQEQSSRIELSRTP